MVYCPAQSAVLYFLALIARKPFSHRFEATPCGRVFQSLPIPPLNPQIGVIAYEDDSKLFMLVMVPGLW
ncbi:MAG: hypothetical protein C0407_16515 [Desulfobacca sp.]|nr:hypothetical protein [Desulfobacca sp.]